MKRFRFLLALVLALSAFQNANAALDFSVADSIVMAGISEGLVPGAVLCVVEDGQIAYIQAYGYRRVYPYQEEMTVETIFDLASLSKPTGAGSAALLLCQAGKLSVDDKVSTYIPNFHADVCVRHLMKHYSGLPAYFYAPRLDSICVARGLEGKERQDFLVDSIARCRRTHNVDEKYRYSCLNFISLQRVVETIIGQDINSYLRSTLYADLGCNTMGWLPDASLNDRIAPTECIDDECLLGQVHDPVARMIMCGVSGNAGVFATATEVAKWAIWFMNLPADVREQGCQAGLWTDTVTTSLGEQQSCRHTGYTGTSVTILPQSRRAVILLTNRVHPKDEHSLGGLRRQLNEWLNP